MKAFPTLADNGHSATQDGMDLRDWFAGLAMQVFLAEKKSDGELLWDMSDAAEISYEMADSMMKAREQ